MEKRNEETDLDPEPPANTTFGRPLQPTVPPQNRSWVIPTLIVALILSLGIAGFFAYQNFQMVQRKAIKLSSISPTVTAPPSEPTPTSKSPVLHANSFNYNNFTIGYPDDWTVLESTSENFPLKERISQGKAIALNKDDIYLIVTIENASGDVGAGGIFINNRDYEEFISDRDRVIIGSSTFYLTKSHHAIPTLLEAHSGPYVWSSLAEYIPNKATKAGTTYNGYESVIRRNGYIYNFIVVGDEEEITDQQIQSELISIVESIQW